MLDLCTYLGVKENEEFKIDGYPYKYKVKDNTLYQSYDKKYYLSTLSVNSIKNVIKLIPKKRFSKETLSFFSFINEQWNWIAKDKDGSVCAYSKKPSKMGNNWLPEPADEATPCFDDFKGTLFKEIHWEDDEPIFIDSYVER